LEAARVFCVMDNLNTHTPASFYEVFPPEQAKALIDRLEIHLDQHFSKPRKACNP